MSEMIALKARLPKHLKGTTFSGSNPFAAASSHSGLKTLTTKGGVFSVEYGDFRELLSETTIDVVILASNPNKSKTYFEGNFEEGFSKLTCYSNNGTTPSENAESPQSKKCLICPHGQWGSRITERGGKGKACSDSMRLCVATTDNIDEVMLLKVSATALKTLGSYGSQLVKRGVDPKYVVTQLGFNPELEYPSLTFRAIRFIEEDELKIVDQVIKVENNTIDKITGIVDSPIDTVWGFKTAPTEKKADIKAEKEGSESKKPNVEDYEDVDAALDNLDFDD